MKEQLEESLKEIFELEALDLSAKITDLDEWDSLSSLVIIALLDSDYGITMKNSEITAFNSIKEFCDYVIANRK